MRALRASGLAMATTGRLPFFVGLEGLEAVLDVAGAEGVRVRLSPNNLYGGRDGLVMTLVWEAEGWIVVFFVHSHELRLGTLGVRRIQRAWRAWRDGRRRLALCMASVERLGAAPLLRRALRTLCDDHLLMCCAGTSGPPPPGSTS